MTLWGMPRALFLLLLFYKVLRIHVLTEWKENKDEKERV